MRENSFQLETLISNPIFLSAFFSLVTAQLIKALIVIVRASTTDVKDAMLTFLWRTGGMPSSHSAVAISISAAVAMTEGFSNLFIVSLFLSLIVIRDALGVRRSSGLQSRALNRLGTDISMKFGISYDGVKEVHGHSWPEVLVGAALGLFIALAFCKL